MEPAVPRLFIIVLTNVSGCHQWICCGGFAFLCFIILIWLVVAFRFYFEACDQPCDINLSTIIDVWQLWQLLVCNHLTTTGLEGKMRITQLGVSCCWRCMVVAGRTIASHGQYYSIVSRYLPTCILQQAGKYITICDLTSPEKPLCCHCYVKQCKFGVVAVTSNHRRRKLS